MSLVPVLFLALYLPLSSLTKTDNIAYDNTPKVKSSARRYFPLLNAKVQHKARALPKREAFEDSLSHGSDISSPAIHSSLRINNEDIERRAQRSIVSRRGIVKGDQYRNVIPPASKVALTSTDEDKKDWRGKWITRWQNLKKDALAEAVFHPERGDVIAMTAARPWRTLCGDVNQQDPPTGTCTMIQDCPSEYRMFRGDSKCGKTNFVCCALAPRDYDMYQAFDPTFAESSRASTSSEEARNEGGSREKRHRKRARSKIRMIKGRYKRKRLIKKTIRRLEKEIRRELNRAYRNDTLERRHTLHNLKILIASLKKKIRNERHIAMNKLNDDMNEIDTNLQIKLNKVKQLNHDFLTNDTFRNLIYQGNGMVSPKVTQAKARRSGGGMIVRGDVFKRRNDYFESSSELGPFDF